MINYQLRNAKCSTRFFHLNCMKIKLQLSLAKVFSSTYITYGKPNEAIKKEVYVKSRPVLTKLYVL